MSKEPIAKKKIRYASAAQVQAATDGVLKRYDSVFRRLALTDTMTKKLPIRQIPDAAYFTVDGVPYCKLGSPNDPYAALRCVDWKVVLLMQNRIGTIITVEKASAICKKILGVKHLQRCSRSQMFCGPDHVRLISHYLK